MKKFFTKGASRNSIFNIESFQTEEDGLTRKSTIKHQQTLVFTKDNNLIMIDPDEKNITTLANILFDELEFPYKEVM